jgi:thiol-disulfide isomerase/thioredoxin
MAPELNKIKHEYENQLNFVMLNVDNSKWLPEVLQYRVDGIPHFVFLNDQASAIAQSIGEIPPAIMEANLDALIAGIPLPYAEATGQVSAFKPSVTPQQSNTDPRAHGSTIVN